MCAGQTIFFLIVTPIFCLGKETAIPDRAAMMNYDNWLKNNRKNFNAEHDLMARQSDPCAGTPLCQNAPGFNLL